MDHSARPRQDQKTLRSRLGWQVPCTSSFPTLSLSCRFWGIKATGWKLELARRLLGVWLFLRPEDWDASCQYVSDT